MKAGNRTKKGGHRINQLIGIKRWFHFLVNSWTKFEIPACGPHCEEGRKVLTERVRKAVIS